MRSTQTELQLKAADMRAVDIRRWDEFLAVLEKHSHETAIAMVNSPVDGLEGAQGRAKHAAELVKLLRDAPSTAEKLRK